MRPLLLLFCACALSPLALDAQAVSSTLLSLVFNAVQKQLKISRQRLGVELVVSEPAPDLTQLCHRAKLQSCTKHVAYTVDGYILELHHVPSVTAGAVPVLVMHGNFASSDAFLMRKDGSNLASVLHEAGYDVWLGNWRGSTHSRRHVRLNSSDPRFFDFSIHELGLYDMPTHIDYILNSTGQPSLHLIGHSMGCPAILAGLAVHPEYNAKVRFAALMAPVVWPRNFLEISAKLLFDTFYHEFRGFVKRTNMWDLGPRSPFLHYLIDTFCRDSSPIFGICLKTFELVYGVTDPAQRMKDFLPILAATHPSGSAYKVNLHYAAISSSGRFRPLGRGGRDSHPPRDYNLTAITTPVGLYYGAADVTMSVQDMEPLGRALGALEESYLVPLELFSHFDFVLATDVRGLLYDHMIQTMKNVDLRTSPVVA